MEKLSEKVKKLLLRGCTSHHCHQCYHSIQYSIRITVLSIKIVKAIMRRCVAAEWEEEEEEAFEKVET